MGRGDAGATSMRAKPQWGKKEKVQLQNIKNGRRVKKKNTGRKLYLIR